MDFTFAFDTTLIRIEMTEIWPKYEGQASPPLNRQLMSPLDRVKSDRSSQKVLGPKIFWAQTFL